MSNPKSRGFFRETAALVGAVVRAMLGMTCEGAEAGRNVLMAGDCLVDVGEAGLERSAVLAVIQALTAVSLNRSLLPTAQRDAGFILGRLAGSSPAFLEQIRPDLDRWIQIPAGTFLYSDKKEPVVIDEPFAIGKYPVTNLQYRRFIEAGAYEQPDYWSETGWAWRSGTYDSQATDESVKVWLGYRPIEKRAEPYYWHDAKWNNPLAPVVGITWFEAEAYTHWLSKRLGRSVRLPTEQEWERAAGGVNGRDYAWGDSLININLNCAEFWGYEETLDWSKWWREKGSEAASTTLIGQFPAGNTPEGLADISGNVWEWTNSWYEKEQVNRVLRGGSFVGRRRYARCAYRARGDPDNFGNVSGFRVVSPGIFLTADS